MKNLLYIIFNSNVFNISFYKMHYIGYILKLSVCVCVCVKKTYKITKVGIFVYKYIEH